MKSSGFDLFLELINLQRQPSPSQMCLHLSACVKLNQSSLSNQNTKPSTRIILKTPKITMAKKSPLHRSISKEEVTKLLSEKGQSFPHIWRSGLNGKNKPELFQGQRKTQVFILSLKQATTYALATPRQRNHQATKLFLGLDKHSTLAFTIANTTPPFSVVKA